MYYESIQDFLKGKGWEWNRELCHFYKGNEDGKLIVIPHAYLVGKSINTFISLYNVHNLDTKGIPYRSTLKKGTDA